MVLEHWRYLFGVSLDRWVITVFDFVLKRIDCTLVLVQTVRPVATPLRGLRCRSASRGQSSMKAVVIHEYSKPELLKLEAYRDRLQDRTADPVGNSYDRRRT